MNIISIIVANLKVVNNNAFYFVICSYLLLAHTHKHVPNNLNVLIVYIIFQIYFTLKIINKNAFPNYYYYINRKKQ